MSGSIQFIVNENTPNAFKARRKLKEWFNTTAASEGFTIGELSFVLMSDEELLVYNKQYLEHDYFTDVITFDNSPEDTILDGDILLSLDRIKENAQAENVPVQVELHRVMIHGLLHLMNHDDKTPAKKLKMRSLEDKYLELYGR